MAKYLMLALNGPTKGEGDEELAGGHAERPEVASEEIGGQRKAYGPGNRQTEKFFLFVRAQVKRPGVNDLVENHGDQ